MHTTETGSAGCTMWSALPSLHSLSFTSLHFASRSSSRRSTNYRCAARERSNSSAGQLGVCCAQYNVQHRHRRTNPRPALAGLCPTLPTRVEYDERQGTTLLPVLVVKGSVREDVVSAVHEVQSDTLLFVDEYRTNLIHFIYALAF